VIRTEFALQVSRSAGPRTDGARNGSDNQEEKVKSKTSKRLVQGTLLASLLASPLVAVASSHREPPIRGRTVSPVQQGKVTVLRTSIALPAARR
jgi:hypothetical protein